MGLEYKNRMKNPTKDNKSKLDKESDEEEIKKISSSEHRKEPKAAEENIKETTISDNSSDTEEIKSKDNDNDNKIPQSTSEEKKESKWDKINWNKTDSVEKGESKWDKIDWKKIDSVEKEETKWDEIDWSTDPPFEEKKTEGFKNDSTEDKIMTGGDFKENFEDTDFKEEDTENKDEDLSWLKDYDKSSEDKVFSEGLEKNQVDFETNSVEKQNGKHYLDKDFIDGLNEITNEEVVDENYLKENQQILEERGHTSDNLNDIREDMEKMDKKNELSVNKYNNLINDDLQKRFNEYLNNTGKQSYGDDVNKDYTSKIDDEINDKINPKTIYLVGNKLNGKVYIGKTEKTIEVRWKVHLEKARFVKKARESGKKIYAMHITNALAKSEEKIWETYKIDTASTKKELDNKEKDWIAFFREKLGRNKVYNTHDGGTGGAQPEEILQKSRDTMSKTMKQKWNKDEFKKNQSEAISSGVKKWWENREQIEKENHLENMSKAMKEKWNNDEYRESQSRLTSKSLVQRWKNDEYRQNQSESLSIGMKEHWKDDKIKEKHSKAVSKGLNEYWKRKEGDRINEVYLRNPIKNVKEFLMDIQKLKERELSKKYNRNPNTIRKNIQYILGKDINTLRKARKYLKEIDSEENNSTK